MSRTRSRLAVAALVATLALTACSSGGTGESAAGGEIEEPAGSADVAQSMEELSELLEIAVPEGYILQPDEIGDTGPSDLEKAVHDDGGDDAREVLTRTRFVRGYQRMWTASPEDEIISYVYQFADQAGAAEYTDRLIADVRAQSSEMAMDEFLVPSIAGAVGVNTSDAGFATSSVTFVKGPYSVQVVVNGPSPAGLQAIATAMAEEQHSRL